MSILPRRRAVPTRVCQQVPRGGKRAAGFTLIEMLVVVAILSILTASVGLSVGARTTGTVSDADRLRALDARLRDAALFDNRTAGFRILPGGLVPLTARNGAWTATGDPVPLSADAGWQAGAVVAYLPDGQNTRFAVTFADGARCVSDGWAAVACTAP